MPAYREHTDEERRQNNRDGDVFIPLPAGTLVTVAGKRRWVVNWYSTPNGSLGYVLSAHEDPAVAACHDYELVAEEDVAVV